MEVALPSSQRSTASVRPLRMRECLPAWCVFWPWTALILLGWKASLILSLSWSWQFKFKWILRRHCSMLRLQIWWVDGSRKKGKGNVLVGLGRTGREGLRCSLARIISSWAFSLSPTVPQSLHLPTLTPFSSFVTGNFQNQFIRRGQNKLQLEQLVFVDTPAHLWAFRGKRKNGEPWA